MADERTQDERVYLDPDKDSWWESEDGKQNEHRFILPEHIMRKAFEEEEKRKPKPPPNPSK